MDINIYRHNISPTSGAGQLIVMQSKVLKDNGYTVSLFSLKNSIRASFKNRTYIKKAKIDNNKFICKKEIFIVDHSDRIENADITFIHNVGPEYNSEPVIYAERKNKTDHIVANSHEVKKILIQKQNIDGKRITVLHPGYNSERFNEKVKLDLRTKARQELAVDKELIGFVTSGNFKKRGLSLFLDICLELHNKYPDIFFLVVGGKSFPEEHKNHPIYNSGRLIYKPKSDKPEYWLSALDIFLYPAKFEEFGMVVAEASAMGIPSIMSKRVGASDIMKGECVEFILENSSVNDFTHATEKMLNNKELYSQLCLDAMKSIDYNRVGYAERSMNVIKSVIEKISH